MHQYRIQYQKFLNTITIGDVVVHDKRAPNDFVVALNHDGYWLSADIWIAPGSIQSVSVIA